jgi:hypothetical protein
MNTLYSVVIPTTFDETIKMLSEPVIMEHKVISIKFNYNSGDVTSMNYIIPTGMNFHDDETYHKTQTIRFVPTNTSNLSGTIKYFISPNDASTYLMDWVKDTMLNVEKNISDDDLNLYRLVDTAEEATEHIFRFYDKYVLKPNF